MKTLASKTVLLGIALAFQCLFFKAQESYGEIRGIIKNTSLEIVPYATIKIMQGPQLIGGTQSDDNGRYKYKPLPAGHYELIVMNMEYRTQHVADIRVVPNEATYVDVKMAPNTMETLTVTASIVTYTPPGVDKNMYSMVSLEYVDLKNLANYEQGNTASAVLGMTSDVIESKDGLHFRGARSNASSNFVDGVRTYGMTSVPGMAIDNITVYTGGVPACYGDVTSGVVIINTKSYFSGIREKNIRNAAFNTQRAEEKQARKNKEDEENRLKEIEAEKQKEKEKEKK